MQTKVNNYRVFQIMKLQAGSSLHDQSIDKPMNDSAINQSMILDYWKFCMHYWKSQTPKWNNMIETLLFGGKLLVK